MIENKKGNFMGIVFVVGALFVLVLAGVMIGFGSSAINWVMDETVPELSAIGQVGDWNATQTVDIAIKPVNTFIQNFTWITGVIYIFGLLGVFGVAFAFRGTGDKWLVGLFISVVLILIIGCIFMSNIYEDVYRGTDNFSLILREHTALSFLILYSPAIMSLIAFIAGIILFSGDSRGGI